MADDIIFELLHSEIINYSIEKFKNNDNGEKVCLINMYVMLNTK